MVTTINQDVCRTVNSTIYYELVQSNFISHRT